MAFRATKNSEYDRARSLIADMKRLAQVSHDAMATGNTSANALKQLLEVIANYDAQLADIAAVPGLADFARAQEGDPAYDVAGEFNSVRAAMDAVVTRVLNDVPKHPSTGHVLLETWDASGVSVRSFTPAQTATLRDDLLSLIATID